MKKIFIPALAVLFAASLSGCMFFGTSFDKVAEVKPGDLAGYDAGTRLPSTKAEAETVLTPTAESVFGASSSVMSNAEYRALSKSILQNVPEGSVLDRLFGLRAAAARSVVIDDNSADDGSTLDLKVTVRDESVPDVNGTGSVSVNSMNLSADGNSSETSSTGTVKLSFSADGDISFDQFDYAGDNSFVIEDGQVNFIGNGDLSINVDYAQSTSRIKYNVDIGLKMGLSISADYDTTGIYGGKYIIEFGYKDKQDLDSTDASYINGNVDVTLSIRVYDNSNQLVKEFLYDTQDLTDASSTFL